MQKIEIKSPGSFDRLKLVQAAPIRAAAGNVLVRTESVGVNFADCVVRMGLYPSAKEYVGWPITPGFEFAGVVEEVGAGENSDALAVGDAVFGVVRFGAYATHIEVPFEQLLRVPKGLSTLEAGVIPVAALTAWYALRVLGDAKAGQTVLVHSAGGGVGSMLVQIAKLLGCRVVGVVGASHKAAAVKELGADLVIDKSQEKLFSRAQEFSPEGYELVLDANGVETLRGSYRALCPTGRLIIYGAHTMLSRGSGRANWLKLAWDFLRTPRFDPLRLTNDNKNVMAFNLSYLFEKKELLRPALVQIAQWYSEEKLRPTKIQSFPLAQAAQAHQALQGGETVGKLTLIPSRETRNS